MVDEAPLVSMTDQVLARLKALADGNGLPEDSIQLIETKEQIYELHGEIKLTPELDTVPSIIPGRTRTKGARVLETFAALNQAVEEAKKSFNESSDWLDPCLKELTETPGHGWGLSEARLVLSHLDKVLGATEKCPSCRGHGLVQCPQCHGDNFIVCTYCHGQGQEPCPNCFGHGTDPQNPKNPCPVCHGQRNVPCHACKGMGRMTCPTCQGKGGLPCPDCQGNGAISQEVALNYGANLHFRLGNDPMLPSGLLRMMDRLGLANMAKGHADIVIVPRDPQDQTSPKTIINLVAKVPFAELKVKIGPKPCIISAFGKKSKLSGVTPFLDSSLKPWRDDLAEAAEGKTGLDKALEGRALRDALNLVLAGNRHPDSLRKLYPVGLSQAAAKEIMTNMDLATKRFTRRARGLTSGFCLLVSAALFAGVEMTGLKGALQATLSSRLLVLVEAILPAAMIGVSWVLLDNVTRWTLKRRYPGTVIGRGQNMGKTGALTFLAIVALFILIRSLAS